VAAPAPAAAIAAILARNINSASASVKLPGDEYVEQPAISTAASTASTATEVQYALVGSVGSLPVFPIPGKTVSSQPAFANFIAWVVELRRSAVTAFCRICRRTVAKPVSTTASAVSRCRSATASRGWNATVSRILQRPIRQTTTPWISSCAARSLRAVWLKGRSVWGIRLDFLKLFNWILSQSRNDFTLQIEIALH
jgi:hypothetical protein